MGANRCPGSRALLSSPRLSREIEVISIGGVNGLAFFLFHML